MYQLNLIQDQEKICPEIKKKTFSSFFFKVKYPELA